MYSSKKSFTLIELLVVIAIIGILSSLVVARFSDWGDNARIANTLQWSAGVHRTLGANLVGHWPLNEGEGTDVKDISGYGRDGQINGSPVWIKGINNRDALEFDGNLDFINLGVNIFPDIISKQKASVFAWINFSNKEKQYVGIIDNSMGGGNTTIRFYFGSYYHSASNTLSLRFLIGDGVEASHLMAGITNRVFNNEWHHVGITWGDGVAKAYLNGEIIDSGLIERSLVSSTSNWRISYAFNSTGYGFPGSIDDLQLYSEVLTAEEVGRIYAETKDSYLVYE